MNLYDSDISDLLDRWGNWATESSNSIDWKSYCSGFRKMTPKIQKDRPSLTDEDGGTIDGYVALLKNARPEEFRVIIFYHFLKQPKRYIAKQLKRDEKFIRILIQMGERFIQGCIAVKSAA